MTHSSVHITVITLVTVPRREGCRSGDVDCFSGVRWAVPQAAQVGTMEQSIGEGDGYIRGC